MVKVANIVLRPKVYYCREIRFPHVRDGDLEYHELGEAGHHTSDIDQKLRGLELLDDFLTRRVEGPREATDDCTSLRLTPRLTSRAANYSTVAADYSTVGTGTSPSTRSIIEAFATLLTCASGVRTTRWANTG